MIVGIIGNGFVGESQAFAFSPTNEIRIYDIDPLRSTHSKEETHESDFIFICVPTPMDMNGKQDLSYIYRVFEEAKFELEPEEPVDIMDQTSKPSFENEIISDTPEDTEIEKDLPQTEELLIGSTPDEMVENDLDSVEPGANIDEDVPDEDEFVFESDPSVTRSPDQDEALYEEEAK